MLRFGVGRASGWLLLFALFALVAAELPAQAQPLSEVEARARDAYERGSAAYRRGDFARAATEYATAEALVPNTVTLRAALDAATLADDAVLGTELLARTDDGPLDKELAPVVAAARIRFAHRTGRIVVQCAAGTRCLATIDGIAVEPRRVRVVSLGVHTVSVEAPPAPLVQRIVEVAADRTVPVVIDAIEPSTPPSELPTRAPPAGPSPVWFFASLAVAGVFAGVSVWSGIDTLQRHTNFDAADCDHGAPATNCAALASDGLGAQRRTNVLIATTSALAVGTAALGLFVVRWGQRPAEAIGLVVRGPVASLSAAF